MPNLYSIDHGQIALELPNQPRLLIKCGAFGDVTVKDCSGNQCVKRVRFMRQDYPRKWYVKYLSTGNEFLCRELSYNFWESLKIVEF